MGLGERVQNPEGGSISFVEREGEGYVGWEEMKRIASLQRLEEGLKGIRKKGQSLEGAEELAGGFGPGAIGILKNEAKKQLRQIIGGEWEKYSKQAEVWKDKLNPEQLIRLNELAEAVSRRQAIADLGFEVTPQIMLDPVRSIKRSYNPIERGHYNIGTNEMAINTINFNAGTVPHEATHAWQFDPERFLDRDRYIEEAMKIDTFISRLGMNPSWAKNMGERGIISPRHYFSPLELHAYGTSEKLLDLSGVKEKEATELLRSGLVDALGESRVRMDEFELGYEEWKKLVNLSE